MPQGLRYKAVGETITVQFDFSSIVTDADVLSAPTVTAVVLTGVDATPSSIISGAASVSGYVVKQLITAGTAGVVYSLDCVSTGSSGATYALNRTLAILPDTSAFAPDAGITLVGDLGDGFVGDSGTYQYVASGGQPPYTYSWTGSTPPGASLSTTGLVTYTYTTAGPYNWQVYAQDSVGHIVGILDSNVVYQLNIIATSDFGQVLRSNNFTSWTTVDATTSNNWTSIAGNGAGLILLINNTGDKYNRSTDYGLTWASGNTGITPTFISASYGMVWSSTYSKFYLVGSVGAGVRTGYIYSSPDGITWTNISPVGGKDFRDIAVNAGRLVVVSGSNGNGTYVSTNGTSFTKVNSSYNFTCCEYIASNFIAFYSSGGTPRVYASLDGVVWSLRSTGTVPTFGYSIAGDASAQFIVGLQNPTYEISKSTDVYSTNIGIYSSNTPSSCPTNLAFVGAVIAYGAFNLKVVYSLDTGATFTSVILPTTGSYCQLVYLVVGI